MEETLETSVNRERECSCDIVTDIALNRFGIKYIYPWQRLVISNILDAYEYSNLQSDTNKKDAFEEYEESDSFYKGRQIILLPTGAGKSLCFQVPALILPGPSLIIYPLLALMSDQQRSLEEKSIDCVVFRGGQDESQKAECFAKIEKGAKIILANPEILQNKCLLNKLKTIGIKHIVIDEAHCVSEWGDSFRPSYINLGNIIKEINPPVISAFTATASPYILSRIREILFEGEAHIVRSESDRTNIYYFVHYGAAKKKEVLRLIKSQRHPIVVFCGTRNKSEDMAQEINMCYGRGTAMFYHGGLEKDEKKDIEKWFYESNNGVLCATCAYGMGVDKKNIRTVIHLEPPDTPEAYIQEAGRGGRDGDTANAILIWSLEDSLKYKTYPDNSREAVMRNFAETKDCRRQVLLDALEGERAVCSGCDLCNWRKKKEDVISLYKGKPLKKLINIKKLEKSRPLPDWKQAYNEIKKKKNYYTEEDIEAELFHRMNREYRNITGVNIWTHGDTVEIIQQLKHAGLIKTGKILWKGRLSVRPNP